MKRILCIALCLIFVLLLTVPAAAADPEICFTDNSSFEVGGTVTVDDGKTLMSAYNNGTSDVYNAVLEGDVQYYWMRNDTYYADGPSLTLTEADKGCEFYCMAALYSDADHTQQCGTLYSPRFIVPDGGSSAKIPEITTASLPNGTVGESYYQKLTCTDPDAVFTLFRSSLPDGLYLTQHGEIEGTPTKAGFWYVVIMVTPEGGEEYANTKEFEMYIDQAGPQYSLEIIQVPNKVTYTAGEKLDMTGLRVRIYTPDGFIDSRDGNYLTYSQKTLTTVGEQKIKLTYEDAVEFFIVTVVPAPTEPSTEPATESTTESVEETTEPSSEELTEGSAKKPSKGNTDSGKNDTEKPGKADSGKNQTQEKNDVASNDIILIIIVAIIAFAVVIVAAIAAFVILKLKGQNRN